MRAILQMRIPARRDERGAILVMSIAGVVLAIVCAALAIDLGQIAQERRRDQRVADLAALDAVRDLPNHLAKAQASASRNSFPWASANHSLLSERGNLNAAGDFIADPGGTAVQVTVTSPVKNSFLPGERMVTARAVATLGEPRAQFSVGSKLVGFDTDTATLLNPFFSDVLGTSVNFTGVGYNGVANSTVSVADLIAADNSLGTPSQLLNNQVTVRRLAQATVTALNNKAAGGDAAALAAATFLGNFANNIDSNLNVKLGEILEFDQPDDAAAAGAQINVFDLISTAGQKASISNGNNFVDIPLAVDLDVDPTGTLPLVKVNLSARLKLIEAAKLSDFGPARQVSPGPPAVWETTAETAQIDVDVNLRVSVGSCPGLLCVLDVNLPLKVPAAKAVGNLTAIRCLDPIDTSQVDVAVETSSAEVRLNGGQLRVAVATTPINLNPPLIVDGGPPETLTFTGPFPTAIQSADGNGLGLSTTLQSIPVLGPVLGTLTPISDELDSRFFEPLMDSLGLSVGGADVRALAIDCAGNTPRLVK